MNCSGNVPSRTLKYQTGPQRLIYNNDLLKIDGQQCPCTKKTCVWSSINEPTGIGNECGLKVIAMRGETTVDSCWLNEQSHTNTSHKAEPK